MRPVLGRYTRYVDDFVLMHESPQQLNAWLADIAAWLPERLHARLNERKTVLQPLARGLDFVGHLIKPHSRTTRRRTLRAALQRLEHMPDADTYAAGNSYLGLVRQAAHSHRDQARLAHALLKRGHAVDGAMTRAFRRRAAGTTPA